MKSLSLSVLGLSPSLNKSSIYDRDINGQHEYYEQIVKESNESKSTFGYDVERYDEIEESGEAAYEDSGVEHPDQAIPGEEFTSCIAK